MITYLPWEIIITEWLWKDNISYCYLVSNGLEIALLSKSILTLLC